MMKQTGHSPLFLGTSALFTICTIFSQVELGQTAPRWPGIMNRVSQSQSSVLGKCWTPRGMMALGQRIYPAGCSRMVCKTVNGQPLVEHQFCDPLPKKIPNHCYVKSRSWRRYPDCCPEVFCPPFSFGHSNIGLLGTLRGKERKAGIPKMNERAPAVISPLQGIKVERPAHKFLDSELYTENLDKINPDKLAPFKDSVATQPPLRMSTETIYGIGYSKPHLETSLVSAGTDKPHILIDDNNQPPDLWDPEEKHYLVSPSNMLKNWDDVDWITKPTTSVTYQYEEDIQDSSYPYPLHTNSSHRNSYVFYTDPRNVKTSPLPFYNPDMNLRTTIPWPIMSDSVDISDKISDINKENKVKHHTETPYIMPTTYVPPGKQKNRNKPIIPIKKLITQYPTTNGAWNPDGTSSTQKEQSAIKKENSQHRFINDTTYTPPPPTTTITSSTIPTTKLSKTTIKYHRPTQIKRLTTQKYNAVNSDQRKTVIRLPSVKKSTTPSYERITKRVQTSRPTRKTNFYRKTTVTPVTWTTTTPSSYEFVDPKLNPQDHDIVEFIHTQLDPSALIPGHDEYIQSKFDSNKEYSEKENQIKNKRVKRKRSVADDEEINGKKRGRPVFYIPWRDSKENSLVFDTEKILESMPAKNSYPPTKFEQAAYILKGLSTNIPTFDISKPKQDPTKQIMTVTEIFSGSSSSDRNDVNQFLNMDNEESNNGESEEKTKPKGNITIANGKHLDKDIEIIEESSKSGQPPNDNIEDKENIKFSNVEKRTNFSVSENNPKTSKLIAEELPSKNKQSIENEQTVQKNESSFMKNVHELTMNNNNISFITINNTSHSEKIETPILSFVFNETFTSTTKPHNIESSKRPLEIPISKDAVSSEDDDIQLNLSNSKNESQKTTFGKTRTGTGKVRIPYYRRVPIGRRNKKNNIDERTETNDSDKKPHLHETSQRINNSNRNQRKLPWSPPPLRNREPSSRTMRTRGQVPFLTYERKEESVPDDSIPTASEKLPHNKRKTFSTTGRRNSYNERYPLNQAITQEEIPRKDNITHDNRRRQSYSHYRKKELRNEFQPLRQFAKKFDFNESDIGTSEFFRTVDSSQSIEKVRDSYEESEVYTSESNNPEKLSGREINTQEFNFYSTQPPKNIFSASHRFNYNPNAHPQASTNFYQDFQTGQSQSQPKITPTATSSVKFSRPKIDFISPPYKQFLRDEFPEFHDEDIHNHQVFDASSNNDDEFDFSLHDQANFFENSEEDDDVFNYHGHEVEANYDHFGKGKVPTTHTPHIVNQNKGGPETDIAMISTPSIIARASNLQSNSTFSSLQKDKSVTFMLPNNTFSTPIIDNKTDLKITEMSTPSSEIPISIQNHDKNSNLLLTEYTQSANVYKDSSKHHLFLDDSAESTEAPSFTYKSSPPIMNENSSDLNTERSTTLRPNQVADVVPVTAKPPIRLSQQRIRVKGNNRRRGNSRDRVQRQKQKILESQESNINDSLTPVQYTSTKRPTLAKTERPLRQPTTRRQQIRTSQRLRTPIIPARKAASLRRQQTKDPQEIPTTVIPENTSQRSFSSLQLRQSQTQPNKPSTSESPNISVSPISINKNSQRQRARNSQRVLIPSTTVSTRFSNPFDTETPVISVTSEAPVYIEENGETDPHTSLFNADIWEPQKKAS